MTKIEQIETVDEIIHKWPRITYLAAKENLGLTHEELLTLYMTAMRDGAIFAVYGDQGLEGMCCVVEEDDCARILSLPSSDGGKSNRDQLCIEAITKWCIKQGLDQIRAVTRKLNGSSLGYLGRRLGFKRESMTFIKEI